jgi:hypothetical protein
LFQVAIDTMLHGPDLFNLTVKDVQLPNGKIRSVIKVARRGGTPPVRCAFSKTTVSTLGKWIAASRKKRADYLFPGRGTGSPRPYVQEIIEIADAATPETVNVARLRVDSRKFTVARLAPKKYGDHISHNVKGAGSINFQPQILISCKQGEDEEFIELSAAPEAAGGLPQQGNGNSLPGSGGRR